MCGIGVEHKHTLNVLSDKFRRDGEISRICFSHLVWFSLPVLPVIIMHKQHTDKDVARCALRSHPDERDEIDQHVNAFRIIMIEGSGVVMDSQGEQFHERADMTCRGQLALCMVCVPPLS